MSYLSQEDQSWQLRLLYIKDAICTEGYQASQGILGEADTGVIVEANYRGWHDQIIIKALSERFVGNIPLPRLSIEHRDSQENAGLQAIDVFCSGVSEKYENNEVVWHKEFANRIAVEVEYKF